MSLNKIDRSEEGTQLPKIVIKVIPYKDQRYPTLGDWFYDGGVLTILISDQGNWKKEYLLALHELVEALHCKADNISQKVVDDFDVKFNPKTAIEAGFHQDCPYKKQHSFAFLLEQLAANELNIELDSLVYGDFYKEK